MSASVSQIGSPSSVFILLLSESSTLAFAVFNAVSETESLIVSQRIVKVLSAGNRYGIWNKWPPFKTGHWNLL